MTTFKPRILNKLGDLDSLFVVLVLDQVFVVIVLVVQVNSSQWAKNRKKCIKNTKHENIQKKRKFIINRSF